MAAVFVHKAALDTPSPPEVIAKAYKLTPTELRVLLAIVEVGGVPEVAEALGIAETTVKTHLGRVFEKTGTDARPIWSSSSRDFPIRCSTEPRRSGALSSDRRTRQSIQASKTRDMHIASEANMRSTLILVPAALAVLSAARLLELLINPTNRRS